MKKITVLLLIISILFFPACAKEEETETTQPPATEEYIVNDVWRPRMLKMFDDLYQPGDITCFELSTEDYYLFAKDPDYSVLRENFIYLAIFRKIDSEENPVEQIHIKNNYAKVYLGNLARASWDGRFPIYAETIDFLGSPSAVQSYLQEQNFDVEVVDVVLVTPSDLPILIWVKCADRSLLMTWNEYFYEDFEAEGDVYRIYTPQEYSQKLIEEYNITPPS